MGKSLKIRTKLVFEMPPMSANWKIVKCAFYDMLEISIYYPIYDMLEISMYYPIYDMLEISIYYPIYDMSQPHIAENESVINSLL